MEEALSREAGERIRAARQKKRMSQAALADALGIGRGAVRLIESNAWNAKVSTLRAVCEFLELDPNYVLGLRPRSYIDDFGAIYKTTMDLLEE